MGAVNKIPGVSGGIVPIIFGFYEELIFSFSRLDVNGLVILRKEGLKSFYKHINGCLLYTSPSPRDRQKSRMPCSA